MESLVNNSHLYESEIKNSVDSNFEFERLMRVISEKMDAKNLAIFNIFRQWEIKFSSDFDAKVFNKAHAELEKLKGDYESYMASVTNAREALSQEFQEAPDPDEARGSWDSGREFDRRELRENTLIDLKNYIDNNCASLNEQYMRLLRAKNPEADRNVNIEVAQANSKKEDEPSDKPTPMHDVMSY